MRGIIYLLVAYLGMLAGASAELGINTNKVVFTPGDFDAHGHASRVVTTHQNMSEGESWFSSRHFVTVEVRESETGDAKYTGRVMISATDFIVPFKYEGTILVMADRIEGRNEFILGAMFAMEKELRKSSNYSGVNTNEVIFELKDFDLNGHASKPVPGGLMVNNGSTVMETYENHIVEVKLREANGSEKSLGKIMIVGKEISTPPKTQNSLLVSVDRGAGNGRTEYLLGAELVFEKRKK